MKLTTTLMASSALVIAGTSAFADAHMASEMTIVSWGGAYSASQQAAYHDPYSEMTGVTIINDESSAEAVAKLRAMNEAGNVTWDVVDVVASDAIRLCDEGLALEIDADEQLAMGDDGSTPSEDFGDLLVSDCFIPQIVYSTTAGYRTDLVGDTPPTSICAMFDLETYPGMRSLEKRPINNMEWALLCDGVDKADVYDVLETEEGQAQAFAKLDTIKDNVVWWSAGADTPQLLADGEVIMGTTYNGNISLMVLRVHHRPHWSASTTSWVSIWHSTCQQTQKTQRTRSCITTNGGLITATIWMQNSRLGCHNKPDMTG